MRGLSKEGVHGVVDGMGPKFMDFQLSQFQSKSEYFCITYRNTRPRNTAHGYFYWLSLVLEIFVSFMLTMLTCM